MLLYDNTSAKKHRLKKNIRTLLTLAGLCFILISGFIWFLSSNRTVPITIEGFTVSSEIQKNLDQGQFNLSSDRIEELAVFIDELVPNQQFEFQLELVIVQLDNKTRNNRIPRFDNLTASINSQGNVNFDDLTFSYPGLYKFRISQVLDVTLDSDVVWEMDNSDFHILVTIFENADNGTLDAIVEYDEPVVFVNGVVVDIEDLIIANHVPLTYDEVDFSMHSEYALLVNLTNGLVLFEHQADSRAYPASITKIMTTLIGIEHGQMDETVTVYADFNGLYLAEAMQAGFVFGEERKFSEILHGVLLSSGADATEALANHISGNYNDFVKLMNNKAREIGMNDTNFVTATGLHDENHFTTANDIAKLMKYALANPEFREIFTTKSYELERPNSRTDTLYSTIFMFTDNIEFDGGEILGGRTGFTTPAGRTFASLATNQTDEFILITFGAHDEGPRPMGHINDALTIYSYFLNLSK